MIAVIDIGVSNVGSVVSAFRRLDAEVRVASDAATVAAARAIVLPGVGAFGDGMESLQSKGLIEPIRAAAAAGVPILGFCLGLQLLAEESEEFGRHEGLGLIPGRVVRLVPTRSGERVPNVGWCDIDIRPRSRLLRSIERGTAFYFVHSYHLRCADPSDVTATIRFGDQNVSVAVERGNIFAAQFHPEKSQDAGLKMLAEFVLLAGNHVTNAA
jgi:glutamine amidotransferase